MDRRRFLSGLTLLLAGGCASKSPALSIGSKNFTGDRSIKTMGNSEGSGGFV